jgi:hypothetical protein
LSIHDCCRFSFLCFVFSLFVSVLCPVYSMLQNKNKTQKTKSATIMNWQHWVHRTQNREKENTNKTQKTKSAIMNGQYWVHNTQHRDKENENKTQKTKSAICVRVVSCVLFVVHSWLPILFSLFCFYFLCLRVVSCVLNVVHSWLLPISFSVFCFHFLCLCVVCCVLNVVHSWLLPILFSVFYFYFLFKNKTQKTKSATIMNGQHWVHKTQHGDKQNKKKTQKTKSATIMNGQHWVHKTQHGDKQTKTKHRKLNRQQSWMVNQRLFLSCVFIVVHSWLLPI